MYISSFRKWSVIQLHYEGLIAILDIYTITALNMIP